MDVFVGRDVDHDHSLGKLSMGIGGYRIRALDRGIEMGIDVYFLRSDVPNSSGLNGKIKKFFGFGEILF